MNRYIYTTIALCVIAPQVSFAQTSSIWSRIGDFFRGTTPTYTSYTSTFRVNPYDINAEKFSATLDALKKGAMRGGAGLIGTSLTDAQNRGLAALMQKEMGNLLLQPGFDSTASRIAHSPIALQAIRDHTAQELILAREMRDAARLGRLSGVGKGAINISKGITGALITPANVLLVALNYTVFPLLREGVVIQRGEDAIKPLEAEAEFLEGVLRDLQACKADETRFICGRFAGQLYYKTDADQAIVEISTVLKQIHLVTTSIRKTYLNVPPAKEIIEPSTWDPFHGGVYSIQ